MEIRAINELNKDGGHPNIVKVLRDGWVGHPVTYHFIDMELCNLNLHQYIHDDAAISILPAESFTADICTVIG